jgi:hypothetical protein
MPLVWDSSGVRGDGRYALPRPLSFLHAVSMTAARLMLAHAPMMATDSGSKKPIRSSAHVSSVIGRRAYRLGRQSRCFGGSRRRRVRSGTSHHWRQGWRSSWLGAWQPDWPVAGHIRWTECPGLLQHSVSSSWRDAWWTDRTLAGLQEMGVGFVQGLAKAEVRSGYGREASPGRSGWQATAQQPGN